MPEFERCRDKLCPNKGRHAHLVGMPPIKVLHNVEFTNERGRRIRLSIERGQPGEIVVRLAGPDSVSENIITTGEAYKLMHGLNAVLPH